MCVLLVRAKQYKPYPRQITLKSKIVPIAQVITGFGFYTPYVMESILKAVKHSYVCLITATELWGWEDSRRICVWG